MLTVFNTKDSNLFGIMDTASEDLLVCLHKDLQSKEVRHKKRTSIDQIFHHETAIIYSIPSKDGINKRHNQKCECGSSLRLRVTGARKSDYTVQRREPPSIGLNFAAFY